MGRNVYTHRPSVQGRWTDSTWAKFPVHEMEKRRPLPEYIYDLTPFREPRSERRIKKENLVTDILRTEEEAPNVEDLLVKKPEYLDPRIVKKYKDEE